MGRTYWNNSGTHQVAAALLDLRVPAEGEVAGKRKNAALEKYRCVCNAYYDLYNNGLCNSAAEFRAVFGLSAERMSYKGRNGRKFLESCYERTEQAMDEIVKAAAVEQGLALAVEHAIQGRTQEVPYGETSK